MATELDDSLEGSDRLINYIEWTSDQLGKDCPLYDDLVNLMFARLECDEPTAKVIDSFMYGVCSKVFNEQIDTEGCLKN